MNELENREIHTYTRDYEGFLPSKHSSPLEATQPHEHTITTATSNTAPKSRCISPIFSPRSPLYKIKRRRYHTGIYERRIVNLLAQTQHCSNALSSQIKATHTEEKGTEKKGGKKDADINESPRASPESQKSLKARVHVLYNAVLAASAYIYIQTR